MMRFLTVKVLGYASAGLAGLCAALALMLFLTIKDRDAKAETIRDRDATIRQQAGSITALRKDILALGKTDTGAAESAATQCAGDVGAALARGITLGRSICEARVQ